MLKPTQLITQTLKPAVAADQILIRKLVVEQSGGKDNFSAGVRFAHYGTNANGKKVYGYSTDDNGLPTQTFTDLSIPDVLGMVADGWTGIGTLFGVMEGVASALFVFGAVTPLLAQAEDAVKRANAAQNRTALLAQDWATIVSNPTLTNAAEVQHFTAELTAAVNAVKPKPVRDARNAVLAQISRLKTLTTAADVDLISTEIITIATDQAALAVAGVPTVAAAADAAVALYNAAVGACVWPEV